ncbi:NADPH-dependent F420 reductase [Rhodococcus jostii]|uniref:NADPH-dependent F420 reductase n=1 Tax=Rhodococcus jostii TaxID=132919 RepID=UPI003664A5AD
MISKHPDSPLTIAVIGGGVIGRTLATAWTRSGHGVTFGVRRPQDDDLLQFAAGLGANVTAIEYALAGADTVLLAIAGDAMPEVVPQLAPQLAGKTVIDATNNVGSPVLNSIADLSALAPTARIYRAFNTVGWENFADPTYGDTIGDLLYSGPVGIGQQAVERLIGDTGLRPIHLGDNDKAQLADALTALWFTLAFEQGYGRGVGFKVLTR